MGNVAAPRHSDAVTIQKASLCCFTNALLIDDRTVRPALM